MMLHEAPIDVLGRAIETEIATSPRHEHNRKHAQEQHAILMKLEADVITKRRLAAKAAAEALPPGHIKLNSLRTDPAMKKNGVEIQKLKEQMKHLVKTSAEYKEAEQKLKALEAPEFKEEKKDTVPVPDAVVKSAMKKFEDLYNAGETDVCGLFYTDECHVTVNGGATNGGMGPFTTPTEVPCRMQPSGQCSPGLSHVQYLIPSSLSQVGQFLSTLRNTNGGTNIKFTVTGVHADQHTDTWTADNGTGSCAAEWEQVEPGKWKIKSDAILFVPKPPEPTPVNPLRIGATMPNFALQTTMGDFSFHSFLKRKQWTVFFSHPADFTPVCTTEVGMCHTLAARFNLLNTQLIGVSCDSVEDHMAWSKDILARTDTHDEYLQFPIIADKDRSIVHALGMLDPEEVTKEGIALPARALVILEVHPASPHTSHARCHDTLCAGDHCKAVHPVPCHHWARLRRGLPRAHLPAADQRPGDQASLVDSPGCILSDVALMLLYTGSGHPCGLEVQPHSRRGHREKDCGRQSDRDSGSQRRCSKEEIPGPSFFSAVGLNHSR